MVRKQNSFANKTASSKQARLMSLDVFRGLTIAFMIIVNNPGSWAHVFPPLRHSEWNGCTPTDLVFPSFLFIVGVAMWFSLNRFNFEFSGSALFRILRRVLLIFAVGLFLNIFPHFRQDYSTVRIAGVLQRIAVAYGIGAIIVLSVRHNYIWIITALFLTAYWALLYFFGGADPYSLKENYVLIVDKALLGEEHLYRGFGIPFDPEGILSTLPSVGTLLIGFMSGSLIGRYGKSWQTAGILIFSGAALIIAGVLWGRIFPINKPLWTSSYVLYAGGISMLVLTLIFIIVDIWNLNQWTGFFRVFGMNAIFTYALADIFAVELGEINFGKGDSSVSVGDWIYSHVCCSVFSEQRMASLMFALMLLLFVWLIGLILYRKKIFIRL